MNRKKISTRFKIITFFCTMLFAFALLGVIIYPGAKNAYLVADRYICDSNLKQLGTACIMHYWEENEAWPTKNTWCDTLWPYYESKDLLRCPDDKIGPCSYAMNENIPADAKELPDDLVLFFEAAPGWNQVGGADDVVTDRHRIPGPNIAFADGHVEFVDADDIPNLRWTVEDLNHEQ